VKAILFLAIAGTLLSLPAYADVKAGEKKAQVCLLCHHAASTLGAPTLEQQPASYLFAQADAYRTGKRSEPFAFAHASITDSKPGTQRLSVGDLKEIADYFASKPAKAAKLAVAPASDVIDKGATSAKELGCTACHGEDFRGRNEVPRLAGQFPSYLKQQTTRLNSLAPAIVAHQKLVSLSEAGLDALASYFGTLAP
jgi:cytochrome c553